MIKENSTILKLLKVHNHDVSLLSSIPLRTKRIRKAKNIRREIKKNSILLEALGSIRAILSNKRIFLQKKGGEIASFFLNLTNF
jgi:hypothetical protein